MRPQLFIEKIMPVNLLNQQVYYEHGGNPFKGLHRWYSRKPLSFSRASVLASILPADISPEEFEYLLGLEPGKEIKLYKTPPSSVRIKKVHDYCEKVWGNRTPTILDAFAGGGSIPFEAARYGLNVLASDLNPVAVVTMKAAMEYPLKFGPDLQEDIDKWVKWVGDEAEKRLTEFFPSNPPQSPLAKGGSQGGETVQNYLWAHTVVCPSCQSVVPLSPNWWLSKTSNYAGKNQARKVTSDWYAVKPIPNLAQKRVDFELVKGKKGKEATIKTDAGEYDPSVYNTISRGVGKCPNCGSVIENDYICSPSQDSKLGHQIYAVAYKKGKGSLEFTTPRECDLEGVRLAEEKFAELITDWEALDLISHAPTPTNPQYSMIRNYGIIEWNQCFNPRQLLTLVTYVQIINEAKALLKAEYEPEKVEAIVTYLALIFDRCVDHNSRLSGWHSGHPSADRASKTHALNLCWNYPEISGRGELWHWGADAFASEYKSLCTLFGTKPHSTGLPGIEQYDPKTIQINAASADSLYHIPDKSVDAIITDPPYYGTIPYADISDFFYCLTPDIPIITQRGYIPISEITTIDRVLSLDGSWTEVQKVGSRNYNGDIFEIRVAYNNQKLAITPGHKVWTLKKENAICEGEWVDSKELKKGDYIYTPTYISKLGCFNETLKISDYLDYSHDNSWLYYGHKSAEILQIKQEIQKLGKEYSTLKEIAQTLQVSYHRIVRINNEGEYQKFRIPNCIEIDYDFMKMLGYFLAEGSILNRRSKRKEGRLTFVFHESEKHYVDEISIIVKEKFGCNGFLQKRDKEKAIILNFYCQPLAEFLEKLCGNNSHNKKVPDWILDAPEPLLKGLLAGYWNGDGSTGNDFFQLTTVSPILACQIRLILQRLGIVSHQHFDEQYRTCNFNNKIVKSQPRFLIKVWGKYREKLAQILECSTPKVKHGNYLNLWTEAGQWVPIREIQRKSYSGQVYNLTTTSQTYVTTQCCVHNCWQKRTLGDIFPDLFYSELTDKDREAVANPSRFRNMGTSPDELAKQDYEAKMALAFSEYYRVLRDDGVMTVQFNHKESGAWDVLTKSLIDAGFEITASWAVSTENPQNLHQAQKNSVSSTVLLVCRKRDTNAAQAWWDDLRPEVANLVEQRAPEFEANDIKGIDLYLSAFGPALNVFSRSYPILDSSGEEVRPEVAFAEARKAIANYRFRKLVQTDTAGFDALTQWYLLAWDAFGAVEFPFDEARQLALAIGGFDVADLAKKYKLIDSVSGTCKLLTPKQRLKKRAFSVNPQEFSIRYLVDGLHAIIALYQEEGNIQIVREFMKNTALTDNDNFMRAIEVSLKVIPRIGDEKKRIPEEKALLDLWLVMDEIKAKVVYEQMEIQFEGQLSLF